jgi:hypothetical protein
VGWAPKIIDTFMFGQAQAAVNMAFCLLRRGLFHRIDYQVPPKTFEMDNATCARELVAMGRQIAELHQNMDVVKKFFLNGQMAEPFRPWSDGSESGVGTRSRQLDEHEGR